MDQKLHGTLGLLAGGSTGEVLGKVMAEVKSFAGAAPQSGDITMLMVRYIGSD